MASDPATLIERLRSRALLAPGRRVYTFLADGEEEQGRLTFAELDERARAIAAELRRRCRPGDRALLLYPPGLDFAAAFFGCLYAGLVAVPAYPPRSPRALPRLRSILEDSSPALALAPAASAARIRGWFARHPDLPSIPWLATDEVPLAMAEEWRDPGVRGDDLAFLQYTSGSTSAPKGVMVSHGNLVHNQRVIEGACRHGEESVFVSWLPVYHDLGLIGQVLQAVWTGAHCVLMAPVAFLQHPPRWLRAVSRYRATTSGGPNFAYELCLRKVAAEGLDLSSWQVAFNGAEPVRASTLERFAEAFAPAGFRREALYPCYGLAETTLMVSGGRPEVAPAVHAFDPEALAAGRIAAAGDGGAGRPLVGCGGILSDLEAVIADPETGAACRPGRIGEIWVAGGSVARGYWNRPEETERIFGARLPDGRGPFLRTGDLGFLHEGELFITGRIKDLIILRGRNLYPQDVELAAERSHPALRTGGGAAFSVEATGEERLVIVHEVERHAADREGSAEEIAAAVRQAVAEEHEAAVHEVVLVVPGGVPKTTSGKVQRRACRDLYLRGELDAVGRSRLAPAAAEEPAIAGDALGETLAATPEAERPALVESWLRRTFARLAGTGAAAIDPEAPLTALGLDSLVAIELKNAVEAETGAELSIAALLEGMSLREAARNLTLLAPLGPLEILPTVETPRGASPAAAFISRNPRDAADTSGGGDAPRGVSTVGDAADRSVLSWGQRSLWFLHRLAPDSPAYNIAGAARLAGPFDREALLRALAALADRHPALRTTYAAGAEGPVQRAGERPADAVRRVDASGWSDEEVRAGLHEEAFRPIDLERGPVFRAALFERGEEAWLVLAVHHVAADLWSLAVMTRELGAFYAGAELPEPEARYADFVAWEERRLAGERGERLWSFWRERLAGAPPLDLPTDRPRPPVQTFRGGARSLRLPAADLEAIRNLAAVRGVTLFMALTAGFQALLSRYSGQEDFLVGTPTSGRGSERWAGVVGYFVNTVALRAGLAGDPEADELLERVRRTALDMFEHQDFPFALLAERLQPDRDPSRPHLIQAQLGLEKAPSAELAALPAFALQQGGATLSLGGLELESVALDTPASQMDLTLLAAELEGGLSLWLQHNADLFDAATAERMLGHLGNLLRGMAADPRRRISGIEILSPAERRQIVEEWAGAASDYPRDQPVHALFEEQARRTPGKVALVFQDEETTYAELNARANQLARHLRALGVVPETPIGVALDRSPDLIASFLGILKAGGAYVPLDPAYPRERLAMMTEEVALPFLVTNGEETSRWDVSTGMRIVDLDREREAIAAGSAADPDWPVCGARGLAYVMFTSGSTGRPKAVGVEHRSIVRLVRGAGYTDFGPDQTFLQLAPNSFDAATFEIWGPLLNGGRLALFPGRVPSFAELGEVMARHGVTLLWITTGLFHQVVENRFEILRIPRIIMTGGEVTSPEHVNRVLREIPGARLLHCYGPTENTTFTTCQTLKEPVPQGSTVPIGQAIPNSRIYLVDRSFRPVPVGVPGELVTGGDGLARGYLNRPDLTAEKFVPDPLSGEPGARLYRSGDLIRWRPDGNIEFLARVDQQVKIRGFRVEPGEVEIALARHPAVRAAAVVVAGRGSAGRRLVAYVGADGERAGLASILRAWLRERLPEPMMPAAFVILPELPLNPNGKVDRQALPDPESLEVESETPYEAPRNPAEELIAGIWEEVLGVLGVGRVGVRDDFFALGGHSLLATRVLARLREPFGVEPPVSALFADPTVAGLAAAVEAARRAGASGPEPPPFRRVPRDGSTPLSFAQERLWFLDRLTPGLPVYNVPAGVRLRGDLDADALARALSEAVRRHEALRTVFSEGPTGPVQTVQPAELALAVSDLSSLPDPEEAALRTAVEEAGTPFDLGAAPLLRALLLRIGPRDHLLVLTLHHIASDGWSMTVLFRELEALYAAFRDGRPSPLPELAFQYADFTVWQRAWLAGALEDQLAGWRAALAGAPESLDLPTDRPRPPVQRFRGLSVPVSLSAETARGLRSLARQEGATLFMALLAGFSALLARYSHQEDLVVGSPVANRNRPEIEPLIGFFVNTLPMRARLDGEPSFRELTARVRDAALAAYARQDVPFERLVEAVGARRDLSRSPLFQVMLAVEESPARAPRLAGLEAEPVAIHNGTAKFEITLHLSSSGDGLAGGMEVDSDLFDAATAERMLGHLASLLAAAAADPAAGVRELPLLGESESRQLLEWGGGPGDDTAGSPVFLLHERFAWQAARSPEAPAVVFEGERLSYGELDRRATRLAQTLRAWGVGPGELVALCLERSLEMVVAVLGVLKAGATYVPIDPDYPAERIGFLLADSAAPVLLSQRTVAAGLPEHGCRTLLLDDGWEAQAPAAGEALPAVPPESPAYVIYTSGSTGRPKGVVVSHAHVARLFSSTEAWFGFGPEDVWTLFHSYAFDFSVWEIWGALLYGGRLVVVPYWVSRSPEAFHELLRQEQVTVLNQTPSAFRQLLRADETAPAGELALRWVVFGGEALELASLAPWLDRHGEERPRLVNMYGITETTVHVTYRPLGREDAAIARGSLIGRALPDLRLGVLDRSLRMAPVGVPGEICVGGAGPALGYLGRPELTAERFVPDPFAGEPGARLYRSGDLARWLPDGDLEYLGRIDHQVKVRGFRIELGEIETALARHPVVREAVVLARTEESLAGGPQLVAYVVAGPETAPGLAELRAFAGSSLPDYMLPTALVALERLPLTANGKVDRRALPAPDRAQAQGEETVAPRTPVEALIAGVWADLLGRDRVGVHDDFFALGGHSLLAAQVVSRLRATFGIELPLRTLFAEPTVAGLAPHVEEARRAGLADAPPVRPLPRPLPCEGGIPLSFSQERIWLLDRMAPGLPVYNVPAALRLRGPLDTAALERALAEVVRRQEALRTVFPAPGGQPVQTVRPPEPVPLPVAAVREPSPPSPLPVPGEGRPHPSHSVGLAAFSPSPGDGRGGQGVRVPQASGNFEEALRLAREEAGRPFDLETGPLFRALLVRIAPEDHLLVLTVHHIVCDGWSLAVLFGEIEALYAASPLPEPPVQYADWALWQRERLAGGALEGQLEGWRQALAGAPEALDLPADRPRPAVQGWRGAAEPLEVSTELTARLRDLARRESSTLFMTLLAGFAALLSRYSRQDDLVLGSVVAHRRPEVEGLIGFFINTLPLRADLTGEPTFRELLARVREAALGAWERQDLPFERLVQELQPRRDPSRAPLFQVSFVFQETPARTPRLPGLETELAPLHTGTAKLDLALGLEEAGGRLTGGMEFSADLFDGATVRRMLDHLIHLLGEAVDAPERRVSEIPMLAAGEREQLLAAAAGPAGVPFPEGTVHALVERQAALTPGAVALDFEGETVTYAALNGRANRLARHLRRRGIGPDALIGVYVPRSPELVAGILGILKAGAAYLPLDLAFPRERIAAMIGDARPAALVTVDTLRAALPEGAPPAVFLDADAEALARESAADLPDVAAADNLAFVMYTSGSTGRPKGVAVTHRGLRNRFLRAQEAYRLGPDDAVLHKAPIGFDFSLWEMLGSLAAGGRTVLAKPGGHMDFPYLADLIAGRGVTIFHFVPSMMEAFLAQEGLERCAATPRLAFIGGEALTPALRDRFHSVFPIPLENQYGPTEASIDVTWQTLAPGGPHPSAAPIGRPIAFCSAHVLTPALEPTPAGVPGELHLGGVCLARGYYGRPDLTAERFIPDPFADGGRLYRTGDLVRRLPGGELEYLGRVDQQVKIHGVRIEPGEIEAALLRHPGVREAAVVAQAVAQQGRDGKRLAAFFVADPPAPGPRELRGFLGETLPDAMIPSFFTALPELPRMPNGKLDRRALSRMEAPEDAGEDFVAPRTPAEELLASVWRELLGAGRIGAHDDFFALGGHSLLAARVAARVREAFGIDLPLQALFERPTLAGLAERLDALRRAGSIPEAPPLRPAPRGEDLPLSFGQERLWFLHQLAPEDPAYNIPAAIRLEGALDPGALRAAVERIVLRHEALRTTFRSEDGRPIQRIQGIAPRLDVPLPCLDLSGSADPEDEARRRAGEEALRPFDLESGPVLRATLLRLGEREHVLLFTIHHIAADGWSLGVFVRELAALYGAAVEGREADLPELPVQYADYAVWQRGWLAGEALASRLAWWRGALAGVPALDLPADRPRPAVAGNQGAVRTLRLPGAAWGRVEALARGESVTPFMALLSAVQALLARYSGQDDFAVGSPVAGRDRVEAEGLIGFFVNTLALRGGLAGDPPFRSLLARAREATLGAYAHQDLPFEHLVEALAPERDLGRTPIFQVMLAFGNTPMPPLALPGLTLSLIETGVRASKFDLSFQTSPEGNGLRIDLVYRADLYEAATAERMLAHLSALLAAVAGAPDIRLSELPILSPAERHQLLLEWNTEWNEAPHGHAGGLVHELFAEQAARTPEAAAVVAGGGSLSYAELDRRSNRLARRLRRLGVGPEVRVGLCLETSPDALAGILGILKAGGAWVPMDPAYPAERLRWMLEDSGAPVLLTREALTASLAGTGAVLVPLDRPGDLTGEPDGPMDSGALPESTAYAIYTSGSTGRPKGTLVSHRSLVNFLAWVDERVIRGRDLPLVISLSFDACLKQLLPPLLRGGAVWIPRSTGPVELLAELATRERPVFNSVPSLWRAMLALVEAGEAAAPRLSALILGGEALDRDLVDRTLAVLPGLEIWNVYGPTEATSNAAHARIGAGPIVIGRPAAGARLAVLGRDLEPQPAGVPGELAIGGPGLARGYLDRPGLTAERFIPDPFAALHGSLGARLYRTGDLVRRAMNGDVEFLGRLDHQVKIRGFRIEPGEVETALAGHPAVEQCVAVARRDGGEPRLVAYVVPRGEAASAPSLRAFLAERLPPFLVPAAFVFLPALPLTPTGKIDRRALPAPVAEPAAGEAAPLTPAQELIAGVWADLLGVEIAGAEAHFFELGGHSLLATQAVSRLRAAFGVDLPLRALFEAPTVAALAARVEPMRAWPASSAPPLRPAPRDGDLPLSFAQERLWFLDQLEPESPLYNVPAAVSLRGDLRPEVLAAALGELVRRHEALRTTFELVGGSPRQRISPAASVPLPQVDLSALPEGVRRREAARLAAEEVRRPFDLMRGPLLRASLLRLGADEHAAVVTMHHIVSDGWSAGVLVRETAALYEALAGGWPSPLPELPVQYADFAVWQRSWLRGDALADQIAWWKEELAGAPEVLELPGDRPRPSAPTLRGRHLAVDLGEDLGGSLRALARQRGATLFMTLLAGFQALLARYVSQGGQGGQGDLLVGSPIANRNRPELEGLIGFFVNTLVLRGRTGDDPSFAELLSRARATALGAYEHQDLPFEKLVEELRPGRSAARSPLFQVALALQNAPAAALELPGLTLAPLEAESGTAKFDLTMFLRESGAGLAGSIEYASDLFDTPTVERLAGHFATLLAGAAERPEARLSELPLLTGPELRQMLLDASRTRREYPRDSPIHRLFEEQADRGPERIALVAGDERVTYGELETRANRFARRLMALGVGPETPVGVTLERGVEMIVAFLGILKAGGAYVPLDPAYPPARLELMAEELDLRLTLTEERLRAEAAAIAESDAARPEVRVDPDQLAYVMFTSGSTGRPKAVGVGHRGVVRLVRGADYAGFGPGLVFLQLAPVSFDASTLEIWGPLLNGGRLVLFSSRTPSLEDLQETLEGHGVNALWLTAGLFHQVVEARVEALRGLSQLLAGGDVLSPTAVNRVLSELPGCRMINGYGPTENTTFTCCHTVGSSVPEDRPVPIGRPIANTRVYVLDAFLQPAPAGVPGELFAGGDGLARGYLKRPELTAERFVPSPFAGLADEAGARLYRTGDRARVRPGTDGEMEILGRLDQQVKIRGFRVEPAEVEAALGRCPGVREAAVAVHTDERGSRLVAYVVPTAPDSTAPTHLRSFLRSILPEHMVPSTFVSLPFLPLSPNGKVDRRAVPVPDAAPPAGDHVAPRNAVEEMLAEIWSEVLAADRIGVHDDFFELGGHSLLAVRLVSQVRDAFGVRLQVRMIFDAPTLGEMAEKLAEEMLRQAGEETLQQVFAE